MNTMSHMVENENENSEKISMSTQEIIQKIEKAIDGGLKEIELSKEEFDKLEKSQMPKEWLLDEKPKLTGWVGKNGMIKIVLK